jgi:hypothetical protein
MKRFFGCLVLIFSLVFFWKPGFVAAQSCSCHVDADDQCQINDPSGCGGSGTPNITFCHPQLGTCACVCESSSQGSGGGTEIGKEYVGDNCVETAVGCIGVGSTGEFIQKILTIAIGIGGGVAFLLMIIGTYQVLSSSGDPKRLQAGKELITGAVAGLLLIVFGVFILRVLGADILELPDFGS